MREAYESGRGRMLAGIAGPEWRDGPRTEDLERKRGLGGKRETRREEHDGSMKRVERDSHIVGARR